MAYIKIKPHHFMDVIKLYGAGLEHFVKDEHYQHDFYKIGNMILADPALRLQPTVDGDDICIPCNYYAADGAGVCQDSIAHIKQTNSKDEWNKVLDKRIMELAQLDCGREYTAREFCGILYGIRDQIFDIWQEDDPKKTIERFRLFCTGARKYLKQNNVWLQWAVELQSIAQGGLYYCKDVFDIERFERIREIAAEMLSEKTDIPVDKVKQLFCNEIGYQTPKLDSRAAIFQDDKILLVKEINGTWSLPGGWVDVDRSVKENTIREVKEEAGLDVVAERVIAVQDREKHNLPVYAYKVCKIFVLCKAIGGDFNANIETVERRYFGAGELPQLAEEKNNREQINMCFDAYHDENWVTVFD